MQRPAAITPNLTQIRTLPLPHHRHSRLTFRLLAVAAFGVGLAASLAGTGQGVEQNLQIWRNAMLSHPASGKVALIEIDARTLHTYDSWPLPRGLYGRAIAALDRAGASTAAFDVDFSSRSQPLQDAAFADAIGAAHMPVVLPTFRQSASQHGPEEIENLPLPALREHAQLASVNIAPDEDGVVRESPYGVVTAGVARPALAAMLANAPGNIGKSFPIDGAIDVATIPRISFADLVAGKVPTDQIQGRSFVIGATAVEIGDRYAVPGHGVIPGALVQLMAAETLIGHSAPTDRGPALPLALLAGLLLARGIVKKARHPAVTAAAAGMILALPLVMQAMRVGAVHVVPALLGMAVLAIGDVAMAMLNKLRETRLTDGLTGMPNGRALREKMSQARSKGEAFGHLVVLRFANYADTRAVLDEAQIGTLMQATARRLAVVTSRTIHRVEPNALAWQEFSENEEDLAEQIEAGAALFNAPAVIDNRPVRIVPAFGIARAKGLGSRALDRALVAADQALAQGVRWQWYVAGTAEASDWRLALAAEIDAAMASGAIHPLYQPKYDLHRKQITAAEALVRWSHPTRGAIPPESLVALLEQNGRIADLTLHMLQQALTDQAVCARAGVDLNIAVNISALLPTDVVFMRDAEALLAANPEGARHLTLEITESAQMIHTAAVALALERLTALGVSISIDDYGTGQSTLSYLKNLPASEIKIDKSFVTGMSTSRSDELMVRSTIALAHQLGYKVVAEGVETEAVLDILADAGCDTAQGWLVGRPMVLSSLIALTAPARQSVAA